MEQLELIPHINSRVIDKVVKKITDNPVVAVTELIANSWDAGATSVDINWPNDGCDCFAISDNGHGMSTDEFKRRWIEIGYNRVQSQSSVVEFVVNGKTYKRSTFGRNGLGKFACFCFGSRFRVSTCKAGVKCDFIVQKISGENYFKADLESKTTCKVNGTSIEVLDKCQKRIPSSVIISEIAGSFLFDPLFKVRVNGELVSFSSIPDRYIEQKTVGFGDGMSIDVYIVKRVGNENKLRFGGIAWHVNGRLVGRNTWSSLSDEKILDGRTANARNYIIILKADCLQDSVLPDWTGFYDEDELYKEALVAVRKEVDSFLEKITKDTRCQTVEYVRAKASFKLQKLGHVSQKQWTNFVETTVLKCPSIRLQDLVKLGDILANIQLSQGKYSVLSVLSQLQPGGWDKLNSLLTEWTIDMAKEVLDEIQLRLTLIEELRKKISDKNSLEVQDLQPIIEKTLWIFGPEFETIHFTSNKSIASVFAAMKGVKVTGTSKNRPDFVVLEDGAASFYTTDDYDEDHHEDGIRQLLIVELKAPKVAIGREEKNQPARYVDEFRSKGLISDNTKVTAFVLGANKQQKMSMAPLEEGAFVTKIMLFDSLLKRAEGRLFNLQKKVKDAPFFKAEIGI